MMMVGKLQIAAIQQAIPKPSLYGKSLDISSAEGDCLGPVTSPSPSPARPRIPWWLWPNVLSLDAPLVAVLWQEARAHGYHIKMLKSCDLALGLAVWLIYIADRVLDGFTDTPDAMLSLRHAFYRRHRIWFLGVVIPLLSGWLLWLALAVIPSGITWRGAALAFVVGIYLLHYSVHRKQKLLFFAGNALLCLAALTVLAFCPLPRPLQMLYGMVLTVLIGQSLLGRSYRVPKELLCGYLFALGCGLSVRYLSLDEYASPFSLETLLMALLFALNCIAISCYERRTDRAFDPGAIFQIWPGIARAYPLLLLSLAILSVMAISQAFAPEILVLGGAVFFSTLLLGAVHLFSKRMTPDLARVLVDAALVVPIVIMIIKP